MSRWIDISRCELISFAWEKLKSLFFTALIFDIRSLASIAAWVGSTGFVKASFFLFFNFFLNYLENKDKIKIECLEKPSVIHDILLTGFQRCKTSASRGGWQRW